MNHSIIIDNNDIQYSNYELIINLNRTGIAT